MNFKYITTKENQQFESFIMIRSNKPQQTRASTDIIHPVSCQ